MTSSLKIYEEVTIYDAIKGEKPVPYFVRDNLFIIPSTLDLSGAEMELASETGGQFVLKEIIDLLRSEFEYILIDCPPSLGMLTINALTASDEVIIPLQAQYLAMVGINKLMEVIEKIRKRLNKNLIIGGAFVTQYDGRKILNRDVVSALESNFPHRRFDTKIRDNVALAEAPFAGKDIFGYSPKSYGAEDYMSLSKEIAESK
jgi:chromosome partitioning protein